MRAYQLIGSDEMEQVELADPSPGHGEVVVRVRAVSLNFRDLMVRKGVRRRVVPTSDGAGEVAAVGDGVTGVAVGDRVAVNFFVDWVSGGPYDGMHKGALGGGRDGMLAELVTVPAHAVVPLPAGWSFEQAATLPCAAVTAWNAMVEGRPLRAGQTVLLLGTGGVSVFGLQLAKMFGARTIMTSSSDEKLARMSAMGADVTINYTTTPDWDKAVLAATGGRGVDLVLEVGGAGTLPKSLASTRYGGQIALIGILTGVTGQANPWPLVDRSMDLRGVYVGSRAMFADLVAAIDANGLDPVIDRVFPFAEAQAAYDHLASQTHVGKVVVSV
jgi:NADPH:quinone reductase-like Zn-dependent oxidoreductase